MRRLLLLALALLPGSLAAQTVTMPQTVEVARGRLFAVAITFDGDDFRYVVPPELDAFREYTTDPKEVKLRGVAYSDGMYRIVAVATKVGEDGKAKLSDFQSCLVKVGSGTPPVTVPPVTPPDPPDPPIDPPPAPLTGMRVLMIYESDTPIPKTVYDAMFDPRVEEYLTAKCIKGPDGKTPERRRFDEDSSLANMSPAWQALRAKLPATLPRYPEPNPSGYQVPHIAIGDPSGNVVFSGPVPVDLLELLKKYGG